MGESAPAVEDEGRHACHDTWSSERKDTKKMRGHNSSVRHPREPAAVSRTGCGTAPTIPHNHPHQALP